ncbi:hypothetical protein CDL12_25274 [Handroanthus impetiginosus]|uniref:Uncharacterized protein n=1 Tax=Handroanthus impetiginosus TaxID=429701 RepID=A0A2G9GAA0_9LAMI|nr:hypothetical protein CDL12_25274 [Handroanthus impetiginosus]
MEEGLLQSGERVAASPWKLFAEELKMVSSIAAPMVVVTVSQILTRVVSMMMVGHLGELALSGAAVATSLTNVTGLSVLYSSTCKRTRALFSKDIFPCMREFSGFALPSAFMVCLLIASLHYFIPYSVGAAASTRVSNELGAGCPDKARASVYAANVLSIAEAILACTIILCCRTFFGYAFSNEKEVVDYLGEITPFASIARQRIFEGAAEADYEKI